VRYAAQLNGSGVSASSGPRPGVGAGSVAVLGALPILTAAGHSHDLDDDAVGGLSRRLQAAAGRLLDSLPLLRLG
jgi:hypothetical protein